MVPLIKLILHCKYNLINHVIKLVGLKINLCLWINFYVHSYAQTFLSYLIMHI